MAVFVPAADAGAYWLRPGQGNVWDPRASPKASWALAGAAMAASIKVQKRAVDSLFMRSGPVDFREVRGHLKLKSHGDFMANPDQL
jgi:hypothetical protein